MLIIKGVKGVTRNKENRRSSMRRPTRIISLVLTAILTLSVATVAVAADKATSLDDLTDYVIQMDNKN